MELLTSCSHLQSLCNHADIHRLSLAAISVFTAANRPIVGLASERALRCHHPSCVHPAARNLFVCVSCVHVACHHLTPLSHSPQSHSSIQSHPSHRAPTHSQSHSHKRPPPTNPPSNYSSHISAHAHSTQHAIFLSAEHGHLFCAFCDDFVFNQYLDAAVALHSFQQRAQRHRLTSTCTPIDPPVAVDPPPQPTSPAPLNKKRRLLTPATWAPTDLEVRAIAAHASLFPLTKPRPPVGLFNLGNSCYMNSVLQAFLNAPPLRNFFLADLHRASCPRDSPLSCFACAIDRLVCDSCFVSDARAFGREKGVVSTSALPVPFLVPQSVLDIVWRNVEHLASYAQHDAHEFFMAALDLLNRHCRRDGIASGNDGKNEPGDTVRVEIKLRKDSASHARSSPTAGGDSKRGGGGDGTSGTSGGVVSPMSSLRQDGGGASGTDGPLLRTAASSIIQSLFRGTVQSDVICGQCGYSSPKQEKFYDISLDVDKPTRPVVSRRGRGAFSPNGEGNGLTSERGSANEGSREHGGYGGSGGSRGRHEGRGRSGSDGANGHGEGGRANGECGNSLNECMGRFTEPEILDPGYKMNCPGCGSRGQDAKKQMSIRTLPPIVCFHFKRFEQVLSVRRTETVKIITPVEFPADGLDLSMFQTSEVVRRRHEKERRNGVRSESDLPVREVRENEHAIYDLFAVVNHVGSIDNGHYTALVRREGFWYRCDDAKVTPVKDMQKVVRSEEAYLVFYVQRYANIQPSGS